MGISQVKMPQNSLFYGKYLVVFSQINTSHTIGNLCLVSAEVNFDRFCQVLCFVEGHVFQDLYSDILEVFLMPSYFLLSYLQC